MKKAIHVVLLTDVPNLGKQGDVRRVSIGFAKNKLIPDRLAALATDAAVQQAQRQKERMVRGAASREKRQKELAAAVDGSSLILQRKANEKGTLFGAVRPRDIAQALRDRGLLDVKEEMVTLPGPVTAVGAHACTVNVAPNLVAHCTVIVERQK